MNQHETLSELAFQFFTQLKRWLKSEKAYDNINCLWERFLTGQFQSCIDNDIRMWLLDQKPTTLSFVLDCQACWSIHCSSPSWLSWSETTEWEEQAIYVTNRGQTCRECSNRHTDSFWATWKFSNFSVLYSFLFPLVKEMQKSAKKHGSYGPK